MRSFLGILVGVVLAIVIESGGEILANQFYPAQIANPWDAQQMGAALAARPTGALFMVVLGYLLGALIGGAVGKRISGWPGAAWAPGVVLAAMVALLAFSFPLPGWSVVAMLAAPLIGALLANHFVASSASASADDA